MPFVLLEGLALACGLKLWKLFPCVQTRGPLNSVGYGDQVSIRLLSTLDWSRVWSPLRPHHCPRIPAVVVTLAVGVPRGRIPGKAARLKLSSVYSLVGLSQLGKSHLQYQLGKLSWESQKAVESHKYRLCSY